MNSPALDKTCHQCPTRCAGMEIDGEVECAVVATTERLFAAAIAVRVNAAAKTTKVGCAVLDENGAVYVGCNVEHWFHTPCLHAEVNAIGSMIAGGGSRAVKCVIVADRELFTPCGGCRDMLMQYGGESCVVLSFNPHGNLLFSGTVGELCPSYPR